MRPAPDLVAFVRLEAVQRIFVLLGPDRDGLEAELVGGAKDADGDFGAVGDEDLGDGQGRGSDAGKAEDPAMISAKMLQCKQNRQAVRID